MFESVIAISRLHNRILVIRNLNNRRTFISSRSWCGTKDVIKCGHHNRCTFSLRLNIFKHFNKFNSTYLKVNTNVKNNVLLYRFEKPYLFKIGFIFGVLAAIGCLIMADNVYLYLCKDLRNPNKPLKERLYKHILPLSIIGIGVVSAPAIIIMLWSITVRSVKYVILHKGGNEITLVIYHPFKKDFKLSFPLNKTSCVSSRSDSKSYVAVKLENRRFNYLLDKQGHFPNPELFDNTVGLKRF